MTLKSPHSRRTVDLSQTAAEALLALPAGDEPVRDFVFRSQVGGPIDPDNVDRVFKRHLTAADGHLMPSAFEAIGEGVEKLFSRSFEAGASGAGLVKLVNAAAAGRA